jgi:hypothetical protein
MLDRIKQFFQGEEDTEPRYDAWPVDGIGQLCMQCHQPMTEDDSWFVITHLPHAPEWDKHERFYHERCLDSEAHSITVVRHR